MQILVVSQYFWPENFRINDLVKILVERGHSVTVLTGKPNYPNGKVFETYRHHPEMFNEFNGSKVVRVPMMPRGNGSFRLIMNYLSFVVGACICAPWRLRKKKFDVIFVFEPSPITVGIPAILMANIKKAPVVLWVLDLWPETLVSLGVVRSPFLLSYLSRMVSFIYNRCTLVLGQSHSFLTNIALYCDDKSKIRYLPSWAEEVLMNDCVQKAAEIPEWSNGFTVMFTGNIGEAQDIPAVLNAAEHLRNNLNIRWVIVGDGRKFNWLQSEVIRRGLSKQILLPGRFPPERMPSFYAHASVLLVSLRREPVFSMTIPGKVQSYLMTGIPLLGMLDGEGAAIIRDARAGLTCEAGDWASLAKAVLIFSEKSPTELKQLGLNGLKYAHQEFSCAQLIKRVESFLTEALSISKFKNGN